MIDKIAALLALAEGAATEEEAAAAFGKAQAIAAKYSLDLSVAQARAGKDKVKEEPETRIIEIGKRRQHSNKPLIWLFSTISQNNDVSLLIQNDSTKVYATGMPSDLDNVEALFVAISTDMVARGDRLVRDKNADWRHEVRLVVNPDQWSGPYYIEKPMTAQSARSSFYDGYRAVVGERLREARAKAEEQAQTDHFHNEQPVGDSGDNLPSSMALVLKDKRAAVAEAQDDWHLRTYGRRVGRGSWKGQSNTSHSRSGYSAGREAGARANLSGRRAVGA